MIPQKQEKRKSFFHKMHFLQTNGYGIADVAKFEVSQSVKTHNQVNVNLYSKSQKTLPKGRFQNAIKMPINIVF